MIIRYKKILGFTLLSFSAFLFGEDTEKLVALINSTLETLEKSVDQKSSLDDLANSVGGLVKASKNTNESLSKAQGELKKVEDLLTQLKDKSVKLNEKIVEKNKVQDEQIKQINIKIKELGNSTNVLFTDESQESINESEKARQETLSSIAQ